MSVIKDKRKEILKKYREFAKDFCKNADKKSFKELTQEDNKQILSTLKAWTKAKFFEEF